jgi:hypothetical protein
LPFLYVEHHFSYNLKTSFNLNTAN